ncbi:amidohydrolase family protein [Nocardia sp. R7R-8]|uniref:amidohydrolase family protein n=1 Tax=Nocardia sp. R7R-8 TaxID=3459304 RepID=UPI00403E135E
MNAPATQPNIVYTGGQVIVDSRGPAAEAIWIHDGRIGAVGTADEVIAAAGPDAEHQDLDGAVVIPGLIDTHPHLLHFSGFLAGLVNLADVRDHEEIVALLREKAEQTPKGKWVRATPVGEPHYFRRRGYRDLVEGELPNRHVLDRASTDHPVIIEAWAPVLPNALAMNSAALELLGIDATTPDRASDVWIEKDADGNPTGILRGNVTNYYNDDPFFAGLHAKMPPIVDLELAPGAVIAGMAKYNSMGITTVYEAHAMTFDLLDAYRALRAHNLLTVRVKAAPELQPRAMIEDTELPPEGIRANLEKALAITELEDEWLRFDGITTCTYGPCHSGNLYWPAGYKDAYGRDTTGKRVVSAEANRMAFEFCAEHGLRLNLCAVSPAEIDDHLAMADEVMAEYGLDRTGWVVQHGFLLREDQAKALVDRGFDMTVSMSFTFGKGDTIAERFPADALPLLNPLRQVIDAGLRPAGGMDWGPNNPWEQMQLALTHKRYPSGASNAGPAQVISREEAFDMWTVNGAEVIRWEGLGALAPGNPADIAIVDRNPITCDLDDLPHTRVLRTHLGGRIVHDDNTLKAAAEV